MNLLPKKNAFVLLSTDVGSMIVNKNDYWRNNDGIYGVGHQLFETSMYDNDEINLGYKILQLYSQIRGSGIVAIDCGANIGVNTISWGRFMMGWGSLYAFEAQERIFYALAGNVALNNLFNVKVTWAAVSDSPGILEIPIINYLQPSSFGSVEIEKLKVTEDIGQQLNYESGRGQIIPKTSVDSMGFSRLDFLKIDVEGMELKVLNGARNTIMNFKPCIFIEKIKNNQDELFKYLVDLDYIPHDFGNNYVCFHSEEDEWIIKKLNNK